VIFEVRVNRSGVAQIDDPCYRYGIDTARSRRYCCDPRFPA
jgi:hypothetical protein